MAIDKGIENHLKGLTVVSSSVDSETRTRITEALTALKTLNKSQVWAGIAPEGTKGNYQTYSPISDPPDNKRLGVPNPRYQIDSYSLDYATARRMADLTYTAFDGFGGLMGGTGGIMVECGIYQDARYDYENDTKLHHFMTDVTVLYHA